MAAHTTHTTDSFSIGGVAVAPGQRKHINLDVAQLYDYTQMKMPVEVIRGKKDGPCLFVCAAIHGDEINGVEIVRRLVNHPAMKTICGTLIAVPIVNVFGFNDKSRYLPDRRDLNRCFPGSSEGSLASQMAHIFMTEIVSKCTHGIDLHTGAWHRNNLAQIRANLDDTKTRQFAKAFGAPVVMHSRLRDGSLREAASEKKICTLLYEGGESLRFDESVIRQGVAGILRAMHHIGMLVENKANKPACKAFVAQSSSWVRAPRSGIHLCRKKLGSMVKEGELLGEISDPFGDHKTQIRAHHGGIIIGMSVLPLANKGDALFHIATLDDAGHATKEPHDYNMEMMDPVNSR